MTDRTTLLVRLPPDLLKKVEKLTRRSRKELGVSWSRNDQIAWMLKVYEPPDPDETPGGERNAGD